MYIARAQASSGDRAIIEAPVRPLAVKLGDSAVSVAYSIIHGEGEGDEVLPIAGSFHYPHLRVKRPAHDTTKQRSTLCTIPLYSASI